MKRVHSLCLPVRARLNRRNSNTADVGVAAKVRHRRLHACVMNLQKPDQIYIEYLPVPNCFHKTYLSQLVSANLHTAIAASVSRCPSGRTPSAGT